MPEGSQSFQQVRSPAAAGLRGRCPRCGKGKMFAGFLDVVETCPECGLDYSFADSGDGPAVFIILIVGFLIVGLALAVEFIWHPPYWLHAVIWVPLILGLSIGLLRPLKGWFVAVQYRNKAEEGRLSEG